MSGDYWIVEGIHKCIAPILNGTAAHGAFTNEENLSNPTGERTFMNDISPKGLRWNFHAGIFDFWFF